MRGEAVLVLPLGFLLTHSFMVHAADTDAVPELPDITRDDLKNIAERLKTLADDDVVQQIVGGLGGEEAQMDATFVQKALSSLSELVTRSELSELLEDLQNGSDGAVRQIMKRESSEEDEPFETILLYFWSLRRVLGNNDYLRRQVNEVIQKSAGRLLTPNAEIGEVVRDIMGSEAFKDLEEEIREDMQHKAGFVLPSDEGDDMS